MHFVLALFISLILSHSVMAASLKKKPVAKPAPVAEEPATLSAEEASALMSRSKVVSDSTSALGSNINKGQPCEAAQNAKTEGARNIASASSEAQAFGGPVTPTYTSKGVIKYPPSTGKTEIVKDWYERDVPVSVLSEDDARKLHTRLAAMTEMKYHVPGNGCQARAHLMSQEMEKLGIKPGKMWVDPIYPLGNIQPKLPGSQKKHDWTFHVAPFVLVKKADGTTEKWILDPSLNRKEPLPLEDYKKLLSPNPKWVWFTPYPPQNYDPADRSSRFEGYRSSDNVKANSVIANADRDSRNGTRDGQVLDSR